MALLQSTGHWCCRLTGIPEPVDNHKALCLDCSSMGPDNGHRIRMPWCITLHCRRPVQSGCIRLLRRLLVCRHLCYKVPDRTCLRCGHCLNLSGLRCRHIGNCHKYLPVYHCRCLPGPGLIFLGSCLHRLYNRHCQSPEVSQLPVQFHHHSHRQLHSGILLCLSMK